MARPANLAAYGHPDAVELAASYIFGLAANHGFIDGNKRTAWVTGRVFLADNGLALDFAALDAIQVMEGVAAGRTTETDSPSGFDHGCAPDRKRAAKTPSAGTVS